MNEESKHKKLTGSQIEIWLNDPVTKTYLSCLGFEVDAIEDTIGKGGFLDKRSMENTFGDTREMLGRCDGFMMAKNVVDRLNESQMVEDIDYDKGESYVLPPESIRYSA